MKCLFFLLFSAFYLSISGQSNLNSGASGIRMNRLDFFQENSFFVEKNKVSHEFGLGFGVNKTLFQQRLNPELFYALSSNIKSEKFVKFQILASFHSNLYNSNKKQREIHVFNELLAGFKISFGKKNALTFIPELGLFSESFNTDYFNKISHHLNFNYSAKIAYNYHF